MLSECLLARQSPGRQNCGADILSARRPPDTSNSSNTSCENEIIYCGYRFDPDTQLYYVRNRTYSPVLGRWIQRDPIGYKGGINLYEYAGGGPTAKIDPRGDLPWWVWLVTPILAAREMRCREDFCDQLKRRCEKLVGSPNATSAQITFCQKEGPKCGFASAIGLSEAALKVVPFTGATGYKPPGVGSAIIPTVISTGKAIIVHRR